MPEICTVCAMAFKATTSAEDCNLTALSPEKGFDGANLLLLRRQLLAAEQEVRPRRAGAAGAGAAAGPRPLRLNRLLLLLLRPGCQRERRLDRENTQQGVVRAQITQQGNRPQGAVLWSPTVQGSRGCQGNGPPCTTLRGALGEQGAGHGGADLQLLGGVRV